MRKGGPFQNGNHFPSSTSNPGIKNTAHNTIIVYYYVCTYLATGKLKSSLQVFEFQVPSEMGHLRKSLIAALADKSFLIRVDGEMLVYLLLTVEALAAVLAGEVLLAGMMPHVHIHVAGAAKALAAHFAGIGTLSIVHLNKNNISITFCALDIANMIQTIMCFRSSCLVENAFGHNEHGCGRSPVCVRM